MIPDASDPGARCGARLTIDLEAVCANWIALRHRAAGAECAAAIKGNGYGLGLEQVVGALSQAGCRTFFVALPEEGFRARTVSSTARIFVLGGLIGGTGPDLLAHDLTPALGSPAEIAEWGALARRSGRRLAAALHVDTGMNRLGMRASEAQAIAADARALEGIDPVLIMSHLACGSEPDHRMNQRQRTAFDGIRGLFPGIPGSLANSAGIFLGEAYHHDLVRPGIALYGGAALDAHSQDNPMRPTVSAQARILQVRDVPAGESIGYGAAETVQRDSRIAIVAAGYADGYHRRAGSSDARSGACGVFNGQKVQTIGRVSMDLIAFDVTDCAMPAPQRGDWITLFGKDGIPLSALASHAGTIDYELLTGLGARYHRHYLPVRS